MWIEIKKDIFKDADFKCLNFLLQILTWYPSNSIPRYNIFVNAEQVSHFENYQKLSEFDKQIIEEEFNNAITNSVSSGTYIISNNNNRDNIFNIEEAIIFLMQPVYIVIENSLNDSYFLKTIFHCFDKKLQSFNNKQKLVEFIKNNWIEFVNAGGWTNIDNYVTGKLLSYNKLVAENGKENYRYFRCFVMMDSDKRYPTDIKSTQSKKALKISLEDKDIKVHILTKRAMENYMPDDVIKSPKFSQFRRWTETYKTLNKNQKDYLDYRNGFAKGNTRTDRTTLDTNIQSLYPLSQIDEATFNTLDEGLKQFPKFKDNFPKLFEGNYLVHKQSLLNREGGTSSKNEFLDIIEAIKSLL